MQKQYGKMICISGVDFSGKSTAIELLANYLKSKGANPIIAKQPGCTWVGNKIRSIVKDPESQISEEVRSLLFVADNMAFHQEVAKPLIDTNNWVLCDRNNFVDSLVYQVVDGVRPERLKKMFETVESPRLIDHIIVLDINWETRQERKAIRDVTNSEADFGERNREHFEKLRSAYFGLKDNHVLQQYVNLDSINDSDGEGPLKFKIPISYIDANCSGEEILEKIKTTLKI